MNREKAFQEFWRARHGVSVVGKVGAKTAFNAAIDLMEAEIEKREEDRVHLESIISGQSDDMDRLKAEIERLEKEVAELKAQNEAHKACFEKYIPVEKWDEATLFLSTHGSGLAKDMATREGLAPQESEASDE